MQANRLIINNHETIREVIFVVVADVSIIFCKFAMDYLSDYLSGC